MKKTWNDLYEIAESQSGYFTSGQAREQGYEYQHLHYHLKKGKVQRALRGVYRLTHFPPSEHEDLVAVWLWSDRQGVFSHETALALHNLSDALPSQKYLTLPPTWSKRRLRYPPSVVPSFAKVGPGDRVWNGCLPITSPIRTIQDCRLAHVDPILIDQAIEEGLDRGLFAKEEVENEAIRNSTSL